MYLKGWSGGEENVEISLIHRKNIYHYLFLCSKYQHVNAQKTSDIPNMHHLSSMYIMQSARIVYITYEQKLGPDNIQFPAIFMDIQIG